MAAVATTMRVGVWANGSSTSPNAPEPHSNRSHRRLGRAAFGNVTLGRETSRRPPSFLAESGRRVGSSVSR